MTATKTTDRDFDVQILEDTVQGVFKGKNALVGSLLASSGAIAIRPTMPQSGPDVIGNTITMPYFGVIGDFAANAEDTAATPVAIKMKSETATVARQSLAFEVSRWAQHSGPEDGDPYVESARQIQLAAQRAMDSLIITSAAATPLVKDVYSATVPVSLDWDLVTDGRTKWGDDQDSIVGMVVHSQVEANLRKLRDANGRPLLLNDMINGDSVTRFNGVPLVVSDRVPLTGSSMSSTVTEAGASVGGVGFTGTPTGPWNIVIDIVVGGARGTATFRFSTDGGQTYSATLATAATVALTDTNSDSLVGNNGATGITATFGVATYDAASTYSCNAILKATTLMFQRDACAFWYNANAMRLLTDKDILKDNDVAAMHLYYAAHTYRRRRGGARPGVVKLVHNVSGWTA